MKKKLMDLAAGALFCLLIFSAALLFALQPKEEFSLLEKRYLARPPVLSVRTVSDGSIMERLGGYVTDHFPFRSFFVGLKAYGDRLSGTIAAADPFPADGRLFDRPTAMDAAALDERIGLVNRFCQSVAEYDADIRVDLMLVPSSGAVLLGGDYGYRDEEIIRYVYDRTETENLDLFGAFERCGRPESLYYATDHHWTSRGAYEAARVYAGAALWELPEEESYVVSRYGPFYGSTYSASGLWLTEPDAVELWRSSAPVQVSDENGRTHPGVFYEERLSEPDKYTVFLDGNHPLMILENLRRGEEAEGRRLLVVRDSFSNCLGCFLSDGFDTVVLADLRYYKKPLGDLIAEYGVTDILIEYSVENFAADRDLVFLTAEFAPEGPAAAEEPEEPLPPPNYFAPPPELTDGFFSSAFYFGDSVIFPLYSYCYVNGLLQGMFFGSYPMLTYYETVEDGRTHLFHRGVESTLQEVMAEVRPDILIAALGCNDLASWDLSFSKTSLIRFLEKVRAISPDITIFVQSVMPIKNVQSDFNQAEVDAFNAWLKYSAETYGYCYIELDGYFKGDDGTLSDEYMANPTHINDPGGELWYRELLNVDNYFNFPAKYMVEYDGATGLPLGVESESEAAEPPPAQEPEPEKTLPEEISGLLEASFDLPDMLRLTGPRLESYLGVGEEYGAGGVFCICADNLRPDEIWLAELEDETAAEAVAALARARIEAKAASYENYLPEAYQVIRQGIVVTRGRFVGLFISPDASRMRQVFLRALDEAAQS